MFYKKKKYDMNKQLYKQTLLDNLYAPYKNCLLCPLGSLGRTQVVFGSGNPDARLLLIGEGPGKNEDLEGLPFVGRSGKLLTQTLNALNIAREDLYITNIVKCRPPNNRAPLPNEVSMCKKILLEKQIKIIRPKVICTLGSSAVNALFSEKHSISKVRGTKMNYEGVILIPTYHPAYLLRNPRELSSFAQDLEKAFSISTE